MSTPIMVPVSEIEPVITDASKEAVRTKKTQFVRAIAFDLWVSLGFTDDEGFQIGRTHAICKPDGSVKRLFK